MENTNSEKYDYVIIGAGCAGLASAQYAARGGLSVLVLDVAGAGGQVLQISELENYPGVFPAVDGATYMMTMQKQAESFGAKVLQDNVLSIDKLGADFIVKTKKASYQASCLCLATGAIHRNLDVPGEKELTGRGVSYCATCDGPFFRDKKILVVGGGDSACSEAIYLSTISKDVSIIHRRDKFRAQQAVIDKMLAAGVKPVYDSVVKEIKGEGRVQSVILGNVKTGEQTEVEADAVFIFTGMLPQTDLVEMLPKDPSGYILTDENMETSVPGLFATGDVRSKPFRQVVTAVSDGAIAAHVASERIRNA
jgi:thioredoxin reductase (NADPH)